MQRYKAISKEGKPVVIDIFTGQVIMVFSTMDSAIAFAKSLNR